MNRVHLIILGVIAIAAIGLFILKKPNCQLVDQAQIADVQYMCLVKLSASGPSLKKNICASLKRDLDCVLTEADRPAVEAFISDYVDSCTKNELSINNQCTDQVQRLPL